VPTDERDGAATDWGAYSITKLLDQGNFVNIEAFLPDAPWVGETPITWRSVPRGGRSCRTTATASI
jgi:hypothetical protein